MGEFRAWFGSDVDCLDYLEWLRWPTGFACPACDHRGAWRLGDGRLMCAGCGSRTSVTAGTIFDVKRDALDGVPSRRGISPHGLHFAVAAHPQQHAILPRRPCAHVPGAGDQEAASGPSSTKLPGLTRPAPYDRAKSCAAALVGTHDEDAAAGVAGGLADDHEAAVARLDRRVRVLFRLPSAVAGDPFDLRSASRRTTDFRDRLPTAANDSPNTSTIRRWRPRMRTTLRTMLRITLRFRSRKTTTEKVYYGRCVARDEVGWRALGDGASSRPSMDEVLCALADPDSRLEPTVREVASPLGGRYDWPRPTAGCVWRSSSARSRIGEPPAT